ncbi:hypothetical protein [Mariniluteicoccus flavus]
MTWQTGGMIVGAIAVVYGLFVAFGTASMPERTKSRVVTVGAFVVLAGAIGLFLLPLLRVY